MDILKNRADIFRVPDVLSYKHFSYVDISLFVYFTALLESLATSSMARWLLMMKWRRFQKTCIYCCVSLEETGFRIRCTDWARRCISEWNWFESRRVGD